MDETDLPRNSENTEPESASNSEADSAVGRLREDSRVPADNQTIDPSPGKEEEHKPGALRAFREGVIAGFVDNRLNGPLQALDHVSGGHVPWRVDLADEKSAHNHVAGTLGNIVGAIPWFLALDRGFSKITPWDNNSPQTMFLAGALQGSLFTQTEENVSTGDFLADRSIEAGLQSSIGAARGLGRFAGHHILHRTGVDITSNRLRELAAASGVTIAGSLAGKVWSTGLRSAVYRIPWGSGSLDTGSWDSANERK